ncbi:MAG: rod shape-determining protein RodA [Gammaproteobacteria bacterium]|nr:rod shape-determining protein RodA [Gammaproteobacteria bacterium]
MNAQQDLLQRLHMDVPLLFPVILICGIGLVVLYSAAGQDTDLIVRQGIRIAVALALMFLVAQIPPDQIARWSPWFYGLGVGMLALVLAVGDVGKGAQRWLDLGLFQIQPSEIMKIAVPMVVAWYLADKSLPPGLLRLIVASLLIIIPVVMIARQPNLGTAVLVGAAGVAVLFLSGVRWRVIAGVCLLTALCIPLIWYLMHDYQRVRVLNFLDPQQDPLGAGWNIIQSNIAVGSGGLYGKGWLNGTQSHLEFLPERSTDFVFAVYCEEFGFMGVSLLLSLYAFVIIRGLYIALHAQNTFGRLLAGGLILTFFVYIFVNMGMVTGQLPVVGIPLPLISFGGTSLVTLMVAFGILMAIHTHRRLLSD